MADFDSEAYLKSKGVEGTGTPSTPAPVSKGFDSSAYLASKGVKADTSAKFDPIAVGKANLEAHGLGEDKLAEATSFFTKPTEQQDPSMGRIGTSVLTGAGVGATMGGLSTLPAGGVGAIPGAILGGLEGLGSGIAGEISRHAGAPEGVTLLAEMGGTAIPSAIKKMGESVITKYAMPWVTRTLTKAIPELDASGQAALKAQRSQFGADTFEGFSTTKASTETQQKLSEQLGKDLNLNVPPGEKASSVVLKKVYEDLGSQGIKPFAASPEFKEASANLDVLVKRQKITPAQKDSILSVFKNQVAADPAVKTKAPQDIINMIQHGGTDFKMVYKNGHPTWEGTKIIGKEDENAIREPFNKYMENNAKGPSYNYLKNVQKEEIHAAARDSIPTIINKLANKGDTGYEAALKNISASPEGKKEFAQHLNKYFAEFTPEKGKVTDVAMMREWNGMKDAIKKSGVMSDAQIAQVSQTIKDLPAKLDAAKRTQLIKTIISKSIIASSSDVAARLGQQ